MEGKCLCEAVHFKLSGKVSKLYQCYCSLCRKVSGAASNAATIVSAEQFQWLQGEQSVVQYAKESGFKSEFCSHCGSPVPNKINGGNHYWVPVGLLESSEGLSVAAHLFAGSKMHWQSTDNKITQYDEMPEFSDVIALLEG